MDLYIDSVAAPLPPWIHELLMRHPPATVGDFIVKLSGDLVASGRWVMEAPTDFDALLSRTAVMVLKTQPIKELSPRIKRPVADGLAKSIDDHKAAAAALRDGYPKIAIDHLEQARQTWDAVCESLDVLDAMRSLPPSIKADRFERLMMDLDRCFPHDVEGSAVAIERLGELAEQWSNELKTASVGVN